MSGMPLTLHDRYPIGEQVADDPIIWVIDDFVTAAERTHIIEQAAGRMGTARVSRLGANTVSERRTGSVAWVKHDETPVVTDLVARVGELVGIPSDHAESLQVVHYGETQEYQAHFDAWDIASDKGREKTAVGGNRAVTALMYLNEVEGGGGTSFPKLDLVVEAKPGRLCIFHDLVVGTSARHRHSLHGGMPVTAGEKWACNLWFRERPYQGAAKPTPKSTSKPAATTPPMNRAQRRRAARRRR